MIAVVLNCQGMQVSTLDYSTRRKGYRQPFSLCGPWIFIVRNEVATGNQDGIYFQQKKKKISGKCQRWNKCCQKEGSGFELIEHLPTVFRSQDCLVSMDMILSYELCLNTFWSNHILEEIAQITWQFSECPRSKITKIKEHQVNDRILAMRFTL